MAGVQKFHHLPSYQVKNLDKANPYRQSEKVLGKFNEAIIKQVIMSTHMIIGRLASRQC